MRAFDVYRHPTKGFAAVKQGFSWPGFFFSVIWAFIKKMWGVGLGIVVAALFLLIMESSFEQQGSDLGALLMLLSQLLVYVVVGVKGNDWRRRNLGKRGFKHIVSLEATTPDSAIASAAEQSTLGKDCSEESI